MFGLKEPEPQEISISGTTTTSTGEVSSGTGDSKDAPWVEVMNRKAHAKKTKRLREQEERKLLRESEAKVSPILSKSCHQGNNIIHYLGTKARRA